MSKPKPKPTKEQRKLKELERRTTILERSIGEWHAEMERKIEDMEERLNKMAQRLDVSHPPPVTTQIVGGGGPRR